MKTKQQSTKTHSQSTLISIPFWQVWGRLWVAFNYLLVGLKAYTEYNIFTM
jgi:hypothetical protein